MKNEAIMPQEKLFGEIQNSFSKQLLILFPIVVVCLMRKEAAL